MTKLNWVFGYPSTFVALTALPASGSQYKTFLLKNTQNNQA